MDFKKRLIDHFPLILVLLLSGLIIWPVFLPGYFSHQDDLQVMRIFEMRKCFEDLQIPCRWTPDLGYGNGFPLFNYYNVFPYYLGGILSFVLGFIGAAKALFLIPLILGGVSFYLLVSKIYGKIPGLVGAILFSFAPYRALDIYVRGAIAESFAIALIPLVFYFFLSLIQKKTITNILGSVLSLGAFLTSHNIMVMFFMPILVIWIFYWLCTEKWQNIKLIIITLLLGIGLSAFFLGPAIFEQSLVQTDNLTRFSLDFRANFVSIKQIFLDRNWGYDNLSFQIGWPHWLMAGLVIPFFLMQIKRISKSYIILGLFFIIVFVISLFMMHVKSAFIWEKIGLLRFVQFPWRFLSLAIFSSSFLGSLAVSLATKKLELWLALIVILSAVLLNFGYFRPGEFYYNLTDQEKLSGEFWDEQIKAAIMDYLPKTAIEAREPALLEALLVKGKAQSTSFKKFSDKWEFKIRVDEPSLIEVPVYDFPGWTVKVNGVVFPHGNKNMIGRINFSLNPGEYFVEGNFNNTPIRTMANLTSLASLIGLIILIYYGKSKKIFN